MSDLITMIVGIAGLFVILSGAAYFLQPVSMKKNGFFNTPPPASVKITAFMVGMLFLAFFLLEFLFDTTRHLILTVLAILLFVYSFYGERILTALENRRKK